MPKTIWTNCARANATSAMCTEMMNTACAHGKKRTRFQPPEKNAGLACVAHHFLWLRKYSHSSTTRPSGKWHTPYSLPSAALRISERPPCSTQKAEAGLAMPTDSTGLTGAGLLHAETAATAATANSDLFITNSSIHEKRHGIVGRPTRRPQIDRQPITPRALARARVQCLLPNTCLHPA